MIYFVIPAAGRSKRMGQPKLLLKLRGDLVVHRLLEQICNSDATAICFVMRSDDHALAEAIHAWCLANPELAAKVQVEKPTVPPIDMRASVVYGLARLENEHHPDRQAAWALLPADYPLLTASTINRLIAAWRECRDDILIPTFEGQRGHPTIFRWSLVPLVKQIPYNQGINSLLQSTSLSIREQSVECESVVQDIDTPEDFDNISKKLT